MGGILAKWGQNRADVWAQAESCEHLDEILPVDNVAKYLKSADLWISRRSKKFNILQAVS